MQPTPPQEFFDAQERTATRNVRAVVEACDAALKAANVTFVEQHKVGSGLVAITLKGDVAAVRAAVDADAPLVAR